MIYRTHIRKVISILILLISTHLSFGQTINSGDNIKKNIENSNIADDKTESQSTDSTKSRNVIETVTVYIDFIVDTSGKVRDVEVEKIKCKKCSKDEKENFKTEAIRIVSAMDDFKPKSKPIKFRLPMKFEVEE